MQSLAELSTLQGLEDDHAFQKEVSLKTLVYKAYRCAPLWMPTGRFPGEELTGCCCLLRCFFIAQSYVLVKKWSEALVLYERVLKYAKEVQSKAKNLNNSLKVSLKPRAAAPSECFCDCGPPSSSCRTSLMSRSSLLRSALRSTLCRPQPFWVSCWSLQPVCC